LKFFLFSCALLSPLQTALFPPIFFSMDVIFYRPAVTGSALLLAFLMTGCVQTRITEPQRTAVEQLLLSTATDRAFDEVDMTTVRDRRVFIDPAYFESYDKHYVLGTIRDVLSNNGALLVRSIDDAEVIVEPRSGALSIDSSQSLIGLPSTPIPIPFTGTVQTPEIAIFKTEHQFSVAKLALLAYERESGRHLHSTGPLVGESFHKYYTILGYIRITTTGIPEKKTRSFRRRDRP
jgi:hypothetical protein